jgi:hypothetical protein
MPGSLKGRALRDFIGVVGVKMRRTGKTGAEPLPSRIALVLKQLGVTQEDVELPVGTALRQPKMDENDDSH